MFVPLIPYEAKLLLVCPICSSGLELRIDQKAKAKHLNRLASAFLANELSRNGFLAAVQRIKLLPAIDGTADPMNKA
jgi:hypothetical protein